jgi:ribonuclease J
MTPSLDPVCLRVVPLGGLGEIGLNCLALEQQDGILVIDCGIMFPQDDLGVDVIRPDFGWLLQRAQRIAGVFVTHGHEDHIGALPYLLSELSVPVWGPPHALALVRRRLAENGLVPDQVRLRPAALGQPHQVGPFTVQPVRVAHSLVDATALRIETRAGQLLHTGDFNFDPDPPDGEGTDEAQLRAIGDAGVALMLSDSTNIDVPAREGTERSVGATLDRLIAQSPRRVFVAMFASNVHRLHMLGDIAQRRGRKVCLLGRSMNTQVEVARELGRLSWPSELLVTPEQARSLSRERLLVLAGGSQAERNSALVRLAADSHNQLVIKEGDTVIFSSRIIPGNERLVLALVGALLRKGVRLHTRVTDPQVHASGHASWQEQRHMLELVRPRAFMPIHGTLHHLLRHAELAREWGVRDVVVVENGTTALLDGQGLKRDSCVRHGRVAIASGGELLDREVLLRRAELGRSGVVAVALAVDRSGRILAEPQIAAYGVPSVDGDGAALRTVTRDVMRALARTRRPGGPCAVSDEIRRAVRRRLYDLCGCRPVVQVQLSVASPPEEQ